MYETKTIHIEKGVGKMKIIIEETDMVGWEICLVKDCWQLALPKYEISICKDSWFEYVFEWVMDEMEFITPSLAYLQHTVEDGK